MSKAIERIKSKAEELATLRAEINQAEETHRLMIEAMKERRDTVQNELLTVLRKEKLSSIKTDAGESYTRATRRGINIINPILAFAWAKDNGAVAIDRRMVATKLAKVDKVPAGFEVVENEYISVRKPKANKGEESEDHQ